MTGGLGRRPRTDSAKEEEEEEGLFKAMGWRR
jgi:hypothetical protein